MTRRDWWLGVSLIALVLLIHALLPRYQQTVLERGAIFRLDRWTGHVEIVNFDDVQIVPWIKVDRMPSNDEHSLSQ